MIFLLLKDHVLKYANKIIFCCDYNPKKVIQGLDVLLNGNTEYINKFESLNEYRIRVNNPDIKSYADKFVRKANKHIKKINNLHKRHPIFNNLRFVSLKDVDYCLKFVLSGVSPESTESVVDNQSDTATPQSLNISLLDTYK